MLVMHPRPDDVMRTGVIQPYPIPPGPAAMANLKRFTAVGPTTYGRKDAITTPMQGGFGMVSPEVIRTMNGFGAIAENKFVWAAGGAVLGALVTYFLARR